MKIKSEHYEAMHTAIKALVDKSDVERSMLDHYERSGLTPKRHRWDVMHRALGSRWICDHLYPYADDTHIDTALRRIQTDLWGRC